MSKHPARFSDAVLEATVESLHSLLAPGARVLDPFAGTGRVHALPWDTWGTELEPDWATMHPRTIVANALALPFPNGAFDAIVTSPCYGNRFADHHNARDASRRRSYTHDIGHPLHTDNAGAMQWGDDYQAFHWEAWREVSRVVQPLWGVFALNISDHVRGGRRMRVVGFHLDVLQTLGWHVLDVVPVITPRMRHGANRGARVGGEVLAVLCR